MPSASSLLGLAAIVALVAVLPARWAAYERQHHDRAVASHFARAGHAKAVFGPRVQLHRVPVHLPGSGIDDAPLPCTVLVVPAAEGSKKQQEQQRQQLPIVLLHGFPDDAASFQPQAGALAAAGHDVIIPVLPGYEPSTAHLPPAAYALPAIASALGEVIEWALRERGGGAEKVHLVGHDWGAALASILAGSGSPASVGKVASLVTIAVPHNALEGFLQYPYQFVNSWYMLFFQLPLLPELWLRSGGSWHGLRKLWRDWSPGHTPPTAVAHALTATFNDPGVLPSALQYYRTNVPPMLATLLARKLGLGGGKQSQQEEKQPPAAGVSEAGVSEAVVRAPTLGLVGLRDGCIAHQVFDHSMGGDDGEGEGPARFDHPAFPGGVRVRKLAGGGHFLHQEAPEEVNALLLGWFSRHEAQ